MPFVTTANKDRIRNDIDRTLISKFYASTGRPLSYFGLAGTKLLDLINWKSYLGQCTVVERKNDIVRQLFFDEVFRFPEIEKNLQFLSGDIDQIIVEWRDSDNFGPRFSSYDLYNLDYNGGVLYKALNGDSRRVSALRELVVRQGRERRSFVLLLTVNARNNDRHELDSTIEQIRLELFQENEIRGEKSKFPIPVSYAEKLKMYVPYVLDGLAISHRFICAAERPITYVGHKGSRMIHFGFTFQFSTSTVGRTPMQSVRKIVDSPLLEVENGMIQECTVAVTK